MNDAVYEQGAALVARGVPVIAVWGVMEDGTCACPRGKECSAAGKHPVGTGWQNSAILDEDALYEQIAEADGPRNIGIPLGPKSGFIDIEHDSEEGRATAERLGLPELGTASFTSSRSRHYLFRYDTRLPLKAVLPNVEGLEVRIGADGRGAHSVAPGSTHKTGFTYSWVPGASIHECDVQSLPEALLRMLIDHEQNGQSDAANLITLTQPLKEGGRHDAVRRLTYQFAGMAAGDASPSNLQTAYAATSAMNQVHCDPPLDDAEVRVLVSSAFQAFRRFTKEDPQLTVDSGAELFVRQWGDVDAGAPIATVGNTPRENNLITCGLKRVDDGRWEAGEWRLEFIETQPRHYMLYIPYTRTYANGKPATVETARVRLSPTDMNRADIVASKILDSTGTLDVNPVPGFFNTIWNGKAATKSQSAVVGLKNELLNSAVTVAADAGTMPWIMFARSFMGCLKSPDPETMTATRPDDLGNPSWVEDHGLVFVWSQAIQNSLEVCKGATAADAKDFRDSLESEFGKDIFRSVRFRDSAGKQRRYVCISPATLDRIDDYVDSLS